MAEPVPDSYTPQQFVADASATLKRLGASDEGFKEVSGHLQRLARQPGIVSEEHLQGLHGSGSTATILTEGDDGSCALMLARFPAEAPTPVHNHNSWGIACVVQGRDRYLRWERLDDGHDPDHADLRLVEETELEAGDVVWFHGPPHDIHSQQGIGDAAWELVFFGKNPNTNPRAYFDPEHGGVTYDSAMR
ncbi:MAG: hypothetical protein QM692_14335 [Thermomicrobiales bacterium]